MERKLYTAEDIRQAINSNGPHEIAAIAIDLMQRMVLALEAIAQHLGPQSMLMTTAPTEQEYRQQYFGDEGVLKAQQKQCPDCGSTSDAHPITCKFVPTADAKETKE